MALPEPAPRSPLPQRPLRPQLFSAGFWLFFGLLLVVSLRQTNFSFNDLWGSTRDFVRFFGNFWPLDWRALPQIWRPLLETLQIAWLGTIFGVILGAPWVFWSSRNVAGNPWLLWCSRGVMTVLRSVPDLVYAAVFVGIFALGPLPGVVAITVFTMAILAKLGSEYVEAVDPGPLEALRASGATGSQVIVYGIIPQIAASMVSYILYIFEINVRASTVLGFVGAGGIGLLLNRYTALFQYQRLSVLLLVVFVVVGVIDMVSAYVRGKLN